jgi:hypothetical protein
MTQEEQKPNNPYAFPVSDINGYITDGMTLRDHFAGLAMQGYLSTEHSGYSSEEYHAEQSYKVADAMLKARTT